MKFNEIGLSAGLMKAIDTAGYDEVTPIQALSIPLILKGCDIIGIAQTGTGKTAAFTLPMIDLLTGGRARARMPRALILSPTRELAVQTARNFKTYGKNHPLSSALLIGGVSMGDQTRALNRGADVLVATPGRLLDHVERSRLLLTDIKILVIDEADRMLDMGFIPDIERIIKLLPSNRQMLLFSATMPKPIEKLAKKFMRDPEQVTVAVSGTTADTIDQSLIWTSERDKTQLLVQHLRKAQGNVIIFCNRKRDVDRVYRVLLQSDLQAEALHGDMTQFRRSKVLEKFRSKKLPILVASNVAARGLDIADIAHVINFDVPQNAEDYVHRIGRTGRAGKSGIALTLATRSEKDSIKMIEKLIGNPIPQENKAPPDKDFRNEKGEKRGRNSGRNSRNGRNGSGKYAKNSNGKNNRRRPSSRRKPDEKSNTLPAFLSAES